jgi:hypothetical protein
MTALLAGRSSTVAVGFASRDHQNAAVAVDAADEDPGRVELSAMSSMSAEPPVTLGKRRLETVPYVRAPGSVVTALPWRSSGQAVTPVRAGVCGAWTVSEGAPRVWVKVVGR